MVMGGGRAWIGPRASSKRWALLGIVVVALLLAGCQTRAVVQVTVKPNGSGTIAVDVYLDPEAAAQVGDLSKILAVDDLKRAGWQVTGPAPPPVVDRKLGRVVNTHATPSGSVSLNLQHPFSNLDEANAILEDLSGPDGPYKGLRLDRSSSWFTSKVRFRGNVDLSKGLDTFSDEALTRALGAPLSEVVARSGGTVPKGDDLVVKVQVASDPEQPWQGSQGNDRVTPKLVGTSASLGGRGTPIDVSTSWTNRGHVVATVLAGFVAVLLAAVCVAMVFDLTPNRRRRRRRRRARDRRRRVVPGTIDVPDPFSDSDRGVSPRRRPDR